MTLDEFKSWFEGFTESMESRPSEKQWDRIKQQVKKIDGAVTTYPIFIDRYIPHYPRYWQDHLTCWPQRATSGYGIGNTNLNTIETQALQGGSWNSASAFKSLGLEDFRAVQ